jgi:uncharacterized protein with HEPN domain
MRRLPSEKRIQQFADILENIARIERFTAGFDADGLAGNEQAFYAVLHALLIISEAARRLGNEAEALAPDQPWQSIRSLGNVLRHAYDGVDPGIIWRIVCDDLAGLKRAVGRALVGLRSRKEP